MPRFTVDVVLRFEDVEAPTLDQACRLCESWCNPLFSKADSVGSHAGPSSLCERCGDTLSACDD